MLHQWLPQILRTKHGKFAFERKKKNRKLFSCCYCCCEHTKFEWRCMDSWWFIYSEQCFENRWNKSQPVPVPSLHAEHVYEQSSYVPFVWPVQTQTTHLKIHFGGTLQNELQIASTGARQGSSPGARPWQYPIYRMSVKLTYTQAMFVLMHTLGRLFIHFQYSLGWFVQIRFLNDEAHDRRRRRGATWFHSPIVHLLITRPVLIETMFALIGIVDTKQPFILFCTFYFGWSIRFPFWWSMLESISGY